MLFDTTEPDYNDFDPFAQGKPMPPLGIYPDMLIKAVNIEDGKTKNGDMCLDIEYEVLEAKNLPAGTRFGLMYNTGMAGDPGKWARQAAMRIYAAITGDEQWRGKRINFDNRYAGKPFMATLTVEETADKKDPSKKYKNGKLTNTKVVSVPGQPAQNNNAGQPQQNNNAGQPQYNNNAGQPQQGNNTYVQGQTAPGTTENPPWGGPRT